jgi:hypothetical protein
VDAGVVRDGGVGLGHGRVATISPVTQLAAKISASGSQVPQTLANIAKLRWISPATIAASSPPTIAVNPTATGSGSRAPRAPK